MAVSVGVATVVVLVDIGMSVSSSFKAFAGGGQSLPAGAELKFIVVLHICKVLDVAKALSKTKK